MAGKKIQGGQLVFTIGDDGSLKLLGKADQKGQGGSRRSWWCSPRYR